MPRSPHKKPQPTPPPPAPGGRSGPSGPQPAAARAFANPTFSPDVIDFNASADSHIFGLRNVEPFPPPKRAAVLSLDEVLTKPQVRNIQNSGRIVFHTIGDTGGVKEPSRQFLVADKMADDFSRPNLADRPAFFYHLGDVVYYFGQNQYYHEQFYDPYRNYPAPIFAIPGNHDGDMYPGEAAKVSLEAFLEHFCSDQPVHSNEAADFARTTMTQPGVYFVLKAPFVKIIGLYSNALESPGVISSEGGKYKITDEQKTFLTQQLQQAAADRSQGDKSAVVLAMHHPPFSGDSEHGGSPGMLKDIDDAVKTAKLMPDVVLSGHAHIYQRFTRTVGAQQVPYIVAGTGGFYNLHPLRKAPGGGRMQTPVPGKPRRGKPADHVLEHYVEQRWGYLRMTVTEQFLTGEFLATPQNGDRTAPSERLDAFTVDLTTRKLTAVQTP